MNSSKNRILDAAERVVLRDGGGRLTLDAVAAETQLSKGGVLYHFPTKDDLIRGMIDRLLHEFEADMARLEAADPYPKGRKLRAYLSASFPGQPRHADQVGAALLAAVATNRALLDPVQEHFRSWQEALMNDGADPVLATVIRLAAEGLWASDLFGLRFLEPKLRVQAIDRLHEMAKA